MKVKWGVIGAGGIAYRRTIPEGIVPAGNAELVAVMEVIPDRLKMIADKFAVRAYATVEDLLADSDVEAVYIASPAHLHAEQFIKCAEAGKHILCEKPLAHTLKETERIVEAAARTGVKATEGYMMKFHPLHEHARERVASGKLGKVVMIRGQLSCWYPPIEGAWRQVSEQGGGGSLMDMGTHVFDLMQYILGEKLTSVMALSGTVVHDYAVEDSCIVPCEFESGCQGVVESYFNVRDESCPRRLEIYGTEGSILAEGTIGQGGGTMKEILLGSPEGYDAKQQREGEEARFKDIDPGQYNMYRSEIEYLSQCILEDRDPTLNTVESGLQVLRVTAAAYRSARKGKRIRVD